MTISITSQTQGATTRGFQEAYNLDRIRAGDSVLMEGHQGEAVRQVQERLIALGYLPEGSNDGKLGPQTRGAIESYQADQGLVVDGKVGRDTSAKLFAPDAEATEVSEVEPATTPTPEAPIVDEYVTSDDAAQRDLAADAFAQEDWDSEILDSPETRGELATRKVETLQAVEAAAATLSPEDRNEVQRLTEELRGLYDGFGGWYLTNSGVAADGARANELEGRVIDLLRGDA
ncbi:MAG: peptidoglycan-binding protein [Deltaproteobacteria bacterium]|jgi:hypothetical protein|nr:peptidoglycan-binding protein [Deltaproteobacteria bacterium]